MDAKFLPPWFLLSHGDAGDICSVQYDGVALAANLPLHEARAIVALGGVNNSAAQGIARIVSVDRVRMRELETRCAALREALELAVEDLPPDAAARAEAALAESGESLLERLRSFKEIAESLYEELVHLDAENTPKRAPGLHSV